MTGPTTPGFQGLRYRGFADLGSWMGRGLGVCTKDGGWRQGFRGFLRNALCSLDQEEVFHVL